MLARGHHRSLTGRTQGFLANDGDGRCHQQNETQGRTSDGAVPASITPQPATSRYMRSATRARPAAALQGSSAEIKAAGSYDRGPLLNAVAACVEPHPCRPARDARTLFLVV